MSSLKRRTITMIITDKFRLPSLVGDPGGISLDTNIDQRRGGYGDQPLRLPLQILHLKTLEREIRKDLNILIRRGEGDIHLLLLPQYHCQVHDYGRYQRPASSTAWGNTYCSENDIWTDHTSLFKGFRFRYRDWNLFLWQGNQWGF